MMKSALMISVGHPVRAEDQERAQQLGAEEFARWERWKANGTIENARHYLRRDGNRQQQLGFVILEGSSAQIDAMLQDPAFAEVEQVYARTYNNFTVHRLGTLG